MLPIIVSVALTCSPLRQTLQVRWVMLLNKHLVNPGPGSRDFAGYRYPQIAGGEAIT